MLVLAGDKSGHPGGIAYHIPAFVVHFHLDQDVPGEQLAALGASFAIFEYNLFLSRHNDLENALLHIQALNTQVQVFLDQVFLPGVGMHYIPVRSLVFFCLSLITCSHNKPCPNPTIPTCSRWGWRVGSRYGLARTRTRTESRPQRTTGPARPGRSR